MSGKRIPAAIRSRDKKSVYAIHDIIVLFLDVVMELLTGHRPMQVRAIFNQIIVDHIGIAAGDVDLVGPGKIVQHVFKIRSIISTVAVSAPEWISTVVPAM